VVVGIVEAAPMDAASTEEANSSDSEEETERMRLMLRRHSTRRASLETFENPLLKLKKSTP